MILPLCVPPSCFETSEITWPASERGVFVANLRTVELMVRVEL